MFIMIVEPVYILEFESIRFNEDQIRKIENRNAHHSPIC